MHFHKPVTNTKAEKETRGSHIWLTSSRMGRGGEPTGKGSRTVQRQHRSREKPHHGGEGVPHELRQSAKKGVVFVQNRRKTAWIRVTTWCPRGAVVLMRCLESFYCEWLPTIAQRRRKSCSRLSMIACQIIYELALEKLTFTCAYKDIRMSNQAKQDWRNLMNTLHAKHVLFYFAH